MDAPSDIRLLITEPFRSALATLLTAFDYAADSGADRWQFAIELPDLLARGAALPDLRWLLLRGFAEHAKETTTPGDPAAQLPPPSPNLLPPRHLPHSNPRRCRRPPPRSLSLSRDLH